MNLRRIAGSDAGGIAPGISFMPWVGSRAGIEVNYDHVVYDNIYRSDREATGFGGTVRLLQTFTADISGGLSAAWRQPFNNYTANVAWTNFPYLPNIGIFTVGVEGAYTSGKKTLPNTWDASFTIDYMPEIPMSRDVAQPTIDPFVPWSASPAVYLPQVLAIVDERVDVSSPAVTPAPICIAPTVIATIPPQVADPYHF